MQKNRPTPKRRDAAARLAAQAEENRAWRARLAADYSAIVAERRRHRDNERKKKAADQAENT